MPIHPTHKRKAAQKRYKRKRALAEIRQAREAEAELDRLRPI